MVGDGLNYCFHFIPLFSLLTMFYHIAHMTQLLSNHSLFTWENYGDEWEIDHDTPFELMDKSLVSDRFKLNNFKNLRTKQKREAFEIGCCSPRSN